MPKLKRHLKVHHKIYLFGILGWRAIFKTMILIAWLFGVINYELQVNKTYAADASIVWDGWGTTNNRSDEDNRAGDVLPSLTDTVIFDTTSTKDVNIDTGLDIRGFYIETWYIWTLSQDTWISITIWYSWYHQADGVFLWWSWNITFLGEFILNWWIFKAPTSKLTVKDIQYNSWFFDHNSGVVQFTTAYPYYQEDVKLQKPLNLYRVNIAGYYNLYITNNGYDFSVEESLDLTSWWFADRLAQNGVITVKKNVLIKSTFAWGFITFKTSGEVNIFAESWAVVPFVQLNQWWVMNVSDNVRIYALTINNGGIFNASTGTTSLWPLYYNTGAIFNHNSGTIKFAGLYPNGMPITLHKNLELYNADIDIPRWDMYIYHNGYKVNIHNLLTSIRGWVGDRYHTDNPITALGDVLIKSTSNIVYGRIILEGNNNVTVESGGSTLAFVAWSNSNPTFNISWWNVYFWSDMRISWLNILAPVTLHSNTTTVRILTPAIYNHPIDPMLDHVLICTFQDSFMAWYQAQSDRWCPGLSNASYSSTWLSWWVSVGNIYNVTFNFINNLWRLTNQDHLLTPRHFRVPVPNSLADWTKNQLQLKVKFFTQP